MIRVLHSRLFPALLVTWLAAAAPTQEWDRPFDGFLPGAEPDHVSVSLVLDARSGAPVSGVKVRQFLEDIAPRTVAAPLVAEAETDAFGLVAIPWKGEPQDCHWIFEKPGFAVHETYGSTAGARVRLEPPLVARGQVLDPFGRPRAGVAVELFLGCGHSPAVRKAVTDERGRFVLRDVPRHGRLWFPFAGSKADYFDLHFDRTTSSPRYATDPGVVLNGLVTGGDGYPVVNTVVRSPQEFRGPTAITGRDGSFVLTGLAPGEPLSVHGPDGRTIHPGRHTYDPERTVRFVLHDPDTDRDGADEKAPVVSVRVRVEDESTGAVVPDVPVFLLRESDGHVFATDVDARGIGEVEAPADRYLLRAGDGFSSHVASPRAVELRENPRDELRIQARPQARLHLQLQNAPDTLRTVDLILPAAMHTVTLHDPAPVFLPVDGPAVVRVRAEGLVRFFPVGPMQEGRRAASIVWPETRQIQVDTRQGWVWSLKNAWFRRAAGGTLVTHASGNVVLVVEHETLGAQEIPVRMPDSPGATIRVAASALRPPGALVITKPDSSRFTSGTVIVDGHTVPVGEDGGVLSWRLTEGAHVTVQAPGLVPLRRRLEGSGPYELTWGRSTVEVEVRALPEFVVYLDGHLFRGKAGRLQLRGVNAEPHTMIVSARGHRGRVMRLMLEPARTRRVEVALTPR